MMRSCTASNTSCIGKLRGTCSGKIKSRFDRIKAVDNFVCLGVLRKHFASVNKYAATSDAYVTHCN